jgi:hypothetical protein
MDTLKWIAGGGVVLLLIYFLTPSDNLWPALFISLLTGIVISVIYYLVTMKSKDIPMAISVLLAVLFISSLAASYVLYERSRMQHDLLTEIRDTIEEGIMTSELITISLDILKNDGSYTEALQDKFGEEVAAGYIIRSEDESNTFSITITELNDDLVILSAVSDWVGGREGDFQNLDGEYGKVQTMVTINQKGAVYERQN